MVNDDFVPRTITIKVGDTVTWTNEDDARHNVGSSAFVSGVIKPGESYTRRFNAAGTYQYVCTFHPDTGGLVEVVPR